MRLAVLLIASFLAAQAHADVLITEREAGLPDNDKGVTSRSVDGPQVQLTSPARGPNAVKTPFAFVIKFEPHDNVPVDLNSLEIVYEKQPAVDLTERVKSYLSPDGVSMPEAETPAGQHRIHVEIKDTDGRLGVADFVINAAH